MGHLLETKIGENGKLTASFFSVVEPAWHGLGTIVPAQVTSAEAIQLANMDYKVQRFPVLMPIGNETIESTEQFFIRRMDKSGLDSVLGYVGNRYTPMQNTEAFSFFDNIVGAGEAFYETAGVLGKGERIFITAKLPDHFDIDLGKGKNDKVKPYIFLTNSHDGKGAVTAAITYTRIVCNNTLQMALRDCKNKFTLRHTKNLSEAMKEAEQVMGITNKYKKEMAEILPLMAKTSAIIGSNTKIWDTIVASAFSSDQQQLKNYLKGIRETDPKAVKEGKGVSQQLINTIDAVRNYDNINPTQHLGTTEGTIWGAVNAVTGYFQNVEVAEKGEKLASILDGRIAKSTQMAWDTAISFLN